MPLTLRMEKGSRYRLFLSGAGQEATLGNNNLDIVQSCMARRVLEEGTQSALAVWSRVPPPPMSPTCTLPYEVLFELLNCTAHAATMQVVPQESASNRQSGATILLHPGEAVSLVLTAGVLYKYTIRQHRTEVDLLVKVWQDSRCNIDEIFAASTRECSPPDGICTVTDGIKVAHIPRLLRA